MNADIKNAVIATDARAQYDECAIRLLSINNIPLERDIEGCIVDMCNLGQGVLERGIAVGMERGMEKAKE